MEHVKSMWSATANPTKEHQQLMGEIKADVVIVGGGFTGLATAYYLGKKGIKSIILEKNRVGWGASGRNAGILTPGYKNNFFSMTKRLGEQGTKELYDISVNAIQMVKQIVDENDINCDLDRNGHLSPAFKPEHYDQLKRKHEYLMEKFNYQTELVTKEELKDELNTSYYYGALLDPNGFAFHPLNYALGLAEVVQGSGCTIYENSNVVSIEETSSKVVAHTEGGKVVADHLVVATNGYTTNTTKQLRKSIISIGSYMVATEPVPDEVKKSMIPKNRSVTDTKKMLYYFRFSEDNRFLFGGRVSFNNSFNSDSNNKFYKMIEESMIEVFPEMEKYKVDYTWGGLTGFTRDFYPQIGSMGSRVHYALGYCGRGASFATFMGWLLAEKIVDREREKGVLEQLPLKRIPLYDFSSRMVNVAGLYYKILDRL